MFEAYRFLCGFKARAKVTGENLRKKGLIPKFDFQGGDILILLPVEQKEALQQLQETNPDQYGHRKEYA